MGSAGEIDFNRDIKPILSENCYFCHGFDEKDRKGDLRLDTFEGATKENEGRVAIVPGDPQASALVQRIFSENPDDLMPPPEAKIKLKPQERDLLKRWIADGAEYQKHWAFIPPAKSDIAAGKHPIDQLVAKALAGSVLSPSPQADKRTLIRRITLDLTGLPPTPEEVAAFLANRSPDAYENVVNHLLASPAYGERMAWDWLDAARYADSNGYQGDNERTMWPWRDWVVKAFNENLPYDQFTVWQIAGDLLPGATFEQKLATGFLRNHPINGEGGRIAEENRVDYVFDMTETFGTVWLGLTLNCCRCHDHKFDPISQREYFQFSDYFNQTPVNGGGGNPQTPPILAAPGEQQRVELAQIAEQIKAVDADITARRKALEKSEPAVEKGSPWRALEIDKADAAAQNLTPQGDWSILASGANPNNDTYTATTKTDLDPIASLRLEALMHPSMTGGALARSDSGNFVLTEIEISLSRPGDSKPLPLKIASAEATFEQGGFKIADAFDGKPGTGWAVHQGSTVDREHAAVFRFGKPIAAGKGSVLTFVLRHDSKYAHHNLGRFRLSLSNEAKAPLGMAKEPEDAALAKLLNQRKDLEARRKKLEDSAPKVMVMADMAKPRKSYILDKGLYTARGEEVIAGTPAALPPLSEDAPRNRLALARWLVAPENPLAARVAVNRFWQQLFGIGLVKTAEDFGTQGETPVQQALLDHLAVGFRESGWDVKALMRHIVTSATYKQSSKATPLADGSTDYQLDPDNRLLSRGPRFRMPSWMLRDSALYASGLLVPEIGGAPVNTYQPDGIWEEATFGKKKYRRDSGDKLYRRSLYTFWRRIIAPPAFFDNAGRQTCSVKPFRTNTPLHALYTFNDTSFVEAARVLAEEALLTEFANDRPRLDFVFKRILDRPADDREAEILFGRLGRSLANYRSDEAAAKALLSAGEHPQDETLGLPEHAAWTALTLAVLNLDEALTKE